MSAHNKNFYHTHSVFSARVFGKSGYAAFHKKHLWWKKPKGGHSHVSNLYEAAA